MPVLHSVIIVYVLKLKALVGNFETSNFAKVSFPALIAAHYRAPAQVAAFRLLCGELAAGGGVECCHQEKVEK